jgi:deoxyadenosine/deoxycytidine kinase
MADEPTLSTLPKWLAIEGVVGAGKTTTSEHVSALTKSKVALERLDDHPFLVDYYRNPKRYVLETELAFMLIQLRQLRQLQQQPRLVSDFAPGKNLIFARLQSSGSDLALLEMVDVRLWGEVPKPDLTVFLDVPLEVCHERLVARGRPYEQGLAVGDLTRMRDAFMESLASLGSTVARLELTGREQPGEVAGAVIQVASPSRSSTAA